MGAATDHAQLLNTWLKSTHIGGPQVMLTAPAPSTDVDIQRFLEREGFVGDALNRARTILEAAGLTVTVGRAF